MATISTVAVASKHSHSEREDKSVPFLDRSQTSVHSRSPPPTLVIHRFSDYVIDDSNCEPQQGPFQSLLASPASELAASIDDIGAKSNISAVSSPSVIGDSPLQSTPMSAAKTLHFQQELVEATSDYPGITVETPTPSVPIGVQTIRNSSHPLVPQEMTSPQLAEQRQSAPDAGIAIRDVATTAERPGSAAALDASNLSTQINVETSILTFSSDQAVNRSASRRARSESPSRYSPNNPGIRSYAFVAGTQEKATTQLGSVRVQIGHTHDLRFAFDDAFSTQPTAGSGDESTAGSMAASMGVSKQRWQTLLMPLVECALDGRDACVFAIGDGSAITGLGTGIEDAGHEAPQPELHDAKVSAYISDHLARLANQAQAAEQQQAPADEFSRLNASLSSSRDSGVVVPLVYAAAAAVFRRCSALKRMKAQLQPSGVFLSAFEIYNDVVYDLSNGQLVEITEARGSEHVQLTGLVRKQVVSAEAVYSLSAAAAARAHWRRGIPRSHVVLRLEVDFREPRIDKGSDTENELKSNGLAPSTFKPRKKPAAVRPSNGYLDIILAAPYARRRNMITDAWSMEQRHLNGSLTNLMHMIDTQLGSTVSCGLSWRSFKLTHLLRNTIQAGRCVAFCAIPHSFALPSVLVALSITSALRQVSIGVVPISKSKVGPGVLDAQRRVRAVANMDKHDAEETSDESMLRALADEIHLRRAASPSLNDSRLSTDRQANRPPSRQSAPIKRSRATTPSASMLSTSIVSQSTSTIPRPTTPSARSVISAPPSPMTPSKRSTTPAIPKMTPTALPQAAPPVPTSAQKLAKKRVAEYIKQHNLKHVAPQFASPSQLFAASAQRTLAASPAPGEGASVKRTSRSAASSPAPTTVTRTPVRAVTKTVATERSAHLSPLTVTISQEDPISAPRVRSPAQQRSSSPATPLISGDLNRSSPRTPQPHPDAFPRSPIGTPASAIEKSASPARTPSLPADKQEIRRLRACVADRDSTIAQLQASHEAMQVKWQEQNASLALMYDRVDTLSTSQRMKEGMNKSVQMDALQQLVEEQKGDIARLSEKVAAAGRTSSGLLEKHMQEWMTEIALQREELAQQLAVFLRQVDSDIVSVAGGHPLSDTLRQLHDLTVRSIASVTDTVAFPAARVLQALHGIDSTGDDGNALGTTVAESWGAIVRNALVSAVSDGIQFNRELAMELGDLLDAVRGGKHALTIVQELAAEIETKLSDLATVETLAVGGVVEAKTLLELVNSFRQICQIAVVIARTASAGRTTDGRLSAQGSHRSASPLSARFPSMLPITASAPQTVSSQLAPLQSPHVSRVLAQVEREVRSPSASPITAAAVGPTIITAALNKQDATTVPALAPAPAVADAAPQSAPSVQPFNVDQYLAHHDSRRHMLQDSTPKAGAKPAPASATKPQAKSVVHTPTKVRTETEWSPIQPGLSATAPVTPNRRPPQSPVLVSPYGDLGYSFEDTQTQHRDPASAQRALRHADRRLGSPPQRARAVAVPKEPPTSLPSALQLLESEPRPLSLVVPMEEYRATAAISSTYAGSMLGSGIASGVNYGSGLAPLPPLPTTPFSYPRVVPISSTLSIDDLLSSKGFEPIQTPAVIGTAPDKIREAAQRLVDEFMRQL